MTLYLYGFTGTEQEAPPSDLRGVAGRPVELLGLGAVQAIVSEVPSEDFTAEAVEERVRELDWVAEQGALHERIVTWFVDHGAVLPARFLTLHSGPGALEAEVGGRAEAMAERLEALAGLREWDVKVTCREDVLAEQMGRISDEVAALDREMAETGPGKRFLLERKRERLVAEASRREARRLAGEAFEELSEGARRARRLDLPTGAEADQPVVLSGALLVAREDEEALARRVEEVRSGVGPLGFEVECTGPWAPYRFLDEADA